MGTTGEPFYPTENSHTTNEEQKQAVEQLVTMGFARSQAEKALRTCGYSVEIAIESLTSGNIPLEDDYPPPPIATGLMPTPAPISTTASSTSIIQQKSSSSSNIPSENSTGTGLNLQELGRTLEKHPEQLETLKERLKSQHPEVAQLIEDDPQAFLELVRQAGELEKPTTTDSTDTVRTNTASTSSINTGTTNSHNSGPASASFNAHELQTIKRIEDIGFERVRVIEAFLACERNEELAIDMTYFAPKSEQEYKEYLDNLLVEYQFACFSEKHGDGCYRLGNYHEVIKTDHPTAGKIYKMSCDEMNYGHGCYRYGTFAFLGRGMDKDIPLSTKYFERACELGFMKGCHNAAIAYMEGDGCEKNINRGLEYYKKACAGSIAESCLNLWSAYFKGHNGDVVKDGPTALDYASKACDLEMFQGWR
ncbi:hypothetical protein I4U23_020747 [Adineta vaga]|nr:hypothetical protein I4U23_020747 [Adineta vaga]